jgi:hypothetical protein
MRLGLFIVAVLIAPVHAKGNLGFRVTLVVGENYA